MIPKVTSCCFCFDLERGTIAIGVITMITTIIELIRLSFILVPLIEEEMNITDLTIPVKGELIEYSAVGIVASLRLFTSLVLVIGVKKKSELCVKVWLIDMIVTLVISSSFAIYEFGKLLNGIGGPFFVAIVLNMLYAMYFYIVVYNYYIETFEEHMVGEDDPVYNENVSPIRDVYDASSFREYLGTKYYTKDVFKMYK